VSTGAVEVTVSEADEPGPVRSLPFAHLSIELGHLYMEDYELGPDHLRDHFRRVRPWVEAATGQCVEALGGRTPRISTCFLVDDYFTEFGTPREIVPQLVTAAGEAGLQIDYLVRESACARSEDVEPARMVESLIVDDPPPGTNGDRPPAREVGWLCNGERSPRSALSAAMRASQPWRPPRQNAANRHSIFVDVELWEADDGRRVWSCPYLAAVWHLLRLGLLRDKGSPVVEPVVQHPPFPDRWADLPAVAQLTRRPAPFTAYRTFSALAPRFLHIEMAATTILGQIAVDATVAAMPLQRAAAERLAVPADIVERIEHAFVGRAWASGKA
jgi:hypothetical protein